MNEVLVEAFRADTWATRQLIACCRPLTVEHLSAPAAGFGSVLATFNHYVGSQGSYLAQIGGEPGELRDQGDDRDLDGLDDDAERFGRAWLEFLGGPVDGERVVVLNDGYQTHVGIVIAQALQHPTLHREQICAILTRLGTEPPDLQPWAYADDTGRGGFPTAGGS